MAGETYSLADVALSPYLNRLSMLSMDAFWQRYPNVADWYGRIQSRDSFQPALRSWVPDDLTAEVASSFRTSLAAELRCIPFVIQAASIPLNRSCCWACGDVGKARSGLSHHIHRHFAPPGLGRRPPTQRRVRPLGVVEADPVPDDAPGREAVGDLVQIDRLVFERAPQPLDEDVVHAPAPAVHRDADAGRLPWRPVKAKLVNWLP